MKFNRAKWIPIILFIYTTAMVIYYFPDHEKRSHYIPILAATYVCIALLSKVLRKKEQLKKEREEDMKEMKG